MTARRARRPSAITAIVAVLTVAALVGAVVAIGSPSNTPTSRERIVTATRGVVQTTVSGSGSLQPSKQLDLSFGASGAVTHVYVKAGDKVVQGQLLAKIDPSSAEADLAQAKADLQTAEDTLTKAQSSGTTTAAATSAAVYSYVSATDTTTTPTDTTTTPTTTAPTTTAPTPTTTTPTTTTPTTTTPKTTTPKQTTTKKAPAATPAQPQQTAAPQSSGGSGGGSGGSTVSVAAAEAGVESAKLTVTKAEKALAATKLIAPTSGTVAAVNGAVGDNVTAGSSGSSGGSSNGSSSSGSSPSVAGGLGASSSSSSSSSSQSSGSGFITLVKVHRFTMDVSLSESDIGSVKIGQAATVTVNAASGQQFAAHVTAIGVLPSSSGSSSAVSYPVTLLLDQSSSSLKAGMSATADIVTAETSGITIPTQALTGSTVTVVQNGKQTTRTVTTGLTGDSSTQIVSGLNAGDQVVVRSAVVTPSATSATGQQSKGLGGGLARPGGGFGGGGFGGGGFGGGGPRPGGAPG